METQGRSEGELKAKKPTKKVNLDMAFPTDGLTRLRASMHRCVWRTDRRYNVLLHPLLL